MFRQNLEHAPDWWMTRMFGADLAKNELLGKFRSLDLVASAAAGGILHRVKLDASENYFRAPHAVRPEHREELTAWSAGSYRRATFAKLVVDRYIADRKPDTAMTMCYNHIKAIVGDLAVLATSEPDLDVSVAALEELAVRKARETMERLFPAQQGEAGTSQSSRLKPPGRDAISGVIHLIERLAVVYAHSADSPALHDHERGPQFKCAYALFRQAQIIIDWQRSIKPVKFSGSSTREFVRTCLKVADLPDVDPRCQFEVETRAREAVNRLSLRMCRYPSERAAILVLEAAFARLSSARDLNAAARLLQEAEPHLPSDANRPRLRFRFLLERAEVAKLMADKAPTNAQREGYSRILARDVAEIKAMAEMLTRRRCSR